MQQFLIIHWLDIFTTILGLLYIWLEYRAHIALWLIGIIMPAMDIYLYWQHGLYGDAGMAAYYTFAGVYGYITWKFRRSSKKHGQRELSISFMPKRLYIPSMLVCLTAWGITYYILITLTDSNIPLLDSFTNALSFIALWALARKYVEQWLFWIVVDIISTMLYVYKGIPFKAMLYGLYTIIAILGYFKWKRLAIIHN